MPSNEPDDLDLDDIEKGLQDKYRGRLSLPKEAMSAICPSPLDRAALDKLMAAVNGAATENEAKAQLIAHAEECGVVVVRILKTISLA